MDKRVIVVIDGNSLINRAYYAMQRPMITKEGLYTHGVYSFITMLEKIKRDHEPGFMAVAFDKSTPTFRHQEYADYKAGRKKMPLELAMQLPLLKEVLAAMNIKTLEMDGFEADDIIGTIVKKAEIEGLEPLVITGDKDELQLASDITRVIITRKGITDFDEYDRAAMIEKYGFTPEQFIDFKGLMGDQSDHIPGIPGVGEKTATALIHEFGSVENIIANADKIEKPAVRNKVLENSRLALMSKRLATINTETPIEFEFDDFELIAPDMDKLIECYKKLEFNSFLKKLRTEEKAPAIATALPANGKANANAVADKSIKAADGEELEVSIISKISELEKMSLSPKEELVLKIFSDNNHRNTPEVYGIFIMSTISTKKAFYISTEEKGLLTAAIELLQRIEPKIIGHDLKDDYYALICNGDIKNINTVFDTAIAQYVLEPSKSNYMMNTLALEYFHTGFPTLKEFMEDNAQINLLEDSSPKYAKYGLRWCKTVLDLKAIFQEKLQQENLERVFYEVEVPLIEVLASMETYGFSVDSGELKKIGEDISKTLAQLQANIYLLAGMEFNINSPQQLGAVLFETLGLPHGKKTTRGYSTNADILEGLRDKHPVVNNILEYRTLSKLNSTYIEGLLPMIHQDGRIHAHFQQTVTATGRISCTEPNLQNIPIRQEYGRTIRKAFVPSEGCTLMSADYSQIELRILAHLSGDPTLVEAFNRDADIHRITAAKVLGIPEDEITSEQRSRAKAVNFGIIYGMSSFGLSEGTGMTRAEADDYIKEYFKKYSTVKEYLDGLVKNARETGYTLTVMDRKRAIPEITAKNYVVRQMGERLAMNSPLQGSAADIIKLAMIKVYDRLREGGYKSRLILQVHDELIIEVAKGEESEIRKLLVESMEGAFKLKVKLSVALNTGSSWYELK